MCCWGCRDAALAIDDDDSSQLRKKKLFVSFLLLPFLRKLNIARAGRRRAHDGVREEEKQIIYCKDCDCNLLIFLLNGKKYRSQLCSPARLFVKLFPLVLKLAVVEAREWLECGNVSIIIQCWLNWGRDSSRKKESCCRQFAGTVIFVPSCDYVRVHRVSAYKTPLEPIKTNSRSCSRASDFTHCARQQRRYKLSFIWAHIVIV